jgi:hypothetical protein
METSFFPPTANVNSFSNGYINTRRKSSSATTKDGFVPSGIVSPGDRSERYRSRSGSALPADLYSPNIANYDLAFDKLALNTSVPPPTIAQARQESAESVPKRAPPSMSLPTKPGASTSFSPPIDHSVEPVPFSVIHASVKSPADPVDNLPKRKATTSSLLKVKTHYGDEEFLIALSIQGVKFDELLSKIERKIRLFGSDVSKDTLLITYEGENGHKMSIRNDEDIIMAFHTPRADRSTIHIFVTSIQ